MYADAYVICLLCRRDMHNVVVRDIPCCARSDMSACADVRDVGQGLALAEIFTLVRTRKRMLVI